MSELVENLKDEDGLTPKQRAFLAAFFGEAKFDVVVAKQMAGYAKTSNTKDVIGPLKPYIEEALESELTIGAAKSVGALIGVLDDPTKPGNREKIQAANSLLDRFGMTKKDGSQTNINLEINPVVYLPEKKETTLRKEDYIDITDI